VTVDPDYPFVHNSGPVVDLANLPSCAELTPEHAKQAASSSAEIRALLKRVSEIAEPGQGCPKVLMAIARLVGQDWVEGDLRVLISGDDASTTLDVMCDHGFGIRERLLPVVRFNVPLDEFERALELAPKLVLPLRITDEEGRLVLTPLASPEQRARSAPPPPIAIDNASLGQGERTTSPPPSDQLQVLDEAAPEEAEGVTSGAITSPPPADELQVVDEATPEDLEELASAAENRAAQQKSGPVPSAKNGGGANDGRPNIHTRPTVRSLAAVDAAAIAAMKKRRDPRREDD
jgi:hypothetical protein